MSCPPKAKVALKTAQRAWLDFRDAEIKADDVKLESLAEAYGGMHKISMAYSKMNIVRQRTLIPVNPEE
ncbi:MAG: DUF1311 domain-containing protein [Elusimicrobia bacterium]|nr:DUF1311 domain-containing protein [Elusimicrobiota bacterium]